MDRFLPSSLLHTPGLNRQNSGAETLYLYLYILFCCGMYDYICSLSTHYPHNMISIFFIPNHYIIVCAYISICSHCIEWKLRLRILFFFFFFFRTLSLLQSLQLLGKCSYIRSALCKQKYCWDVSFMAGIPSVLRRDLFLPLGCFFRVLHLMYCMYTVNGIEFYGLSVFFFFFQRKPQYNCQSIIFSQSNF